MKQAFLTLILAVAAVTGFAQVPVLTAGGHLPRGGDRIERYCIDYVLPGDSGRNVLWDMSGLDVGEETLVSAYKYWSDSTFSEVVAGRVQYNYTISGDTVLCNGFENRLTFTNDTVAAIESVYPLFYGKRVSKPFHRRGVYSDRIGLETTGMSEIHADAFGTLLLPDCDTLRNVLRTRLHSKSATTISYRHPGDTAKRDSTAGSVLLNENIYRWYVAGYKYLVLETRRMEYYGLPDTVLLSVSKGGFLYYPEEQAYDVGEQDAEVVYDNRPCVTQAGTTGRDGTGGALQQKSIGNIDVSNDGNGTVSLGCTLMRDAEMEIIVSDLQGRVYRHIPPASCRQGYFHTSIDCSGLQSGRYLVGILYGNERNAYLIDL